MAALVDQRLVNEVGACWTTLARELACRRHDVSLEELGRAARRIVEGLVFLEMGRQRGLAVPPIEAPGDCLAWLEERYGPALRYADDESFSRRACPPRNRGGQARRLIEAPSPSHGPANGATEPVPDDLLRGLGKRLARLGEAFAAPWPLEMLGRVHERLLEQRLVRNPEAQATVEKYRPARKRTGVFYTPPYVCRYIAERALATLPDTPPSVLDPACGCGAFLLAVVRRLRALGQQRGTAAGPEMLAAGLHGVDVDPEAVLVARRSLWLEILADGFDEVLARRLAERLAAAVRAGDVLLEQAVEAAGPFDVVLGNPPYRRELNAKDFLERIAATEFGRRYRMPRMDLWYYFLHRGLELLRPGGRLSFIVGAYWTRGRGAKKLIDALRQQAHLEEIFALGRLRVFPNVAGQHLILTLTKGPERGTTTVKTVEPRARTEAEPFVCGRAPVAVFQKTAEQLFRADGIDLEPPGDELLARLDRFTPLERLGLIRQGIAENPATVTPRTCRQYGNRWEVGEGVFVLTAAELARLNLPEAEVALIRPYHDLGDLGRYRLAGEPSRWLIYSTAKTCPDLGRYPVLGRHLERFRPIMEARRETRVGRRAWWQLHWPREETLWEAPKLLCVQMARRPALVPALGPAYVPFSVNMFLPGAETREHLYYLAGLLNSRLLWKWFRHHAKRRGVGLEINGHVLARAPIRTIDFSCPAEVARHDRLVELVGRMLKLQQAGAAEAAGAVRPAPQENPSASCDLAETDRQIDRLVYELYGLTDAEVADVERAIS